MPSTAAIRKCLDWLLASGVALLPLACWPDLERPFSTPKFWLVCALAALALLRAGLDRACLQWPAWPWSLWLATTGASALASPLVSIEALAARLVPAVLVLVPPRAALAVAAVSLAESALVVVQRLGWDPLRLAGWHAEAYANPRMSAYGTLGNPDFVAAWLCAGLPLVGQQATGSRLWQAGALLQLAAIAATGSRAAALGLLAAALVSGFQQRGRARLWLLAAGLAMASAAFAVNPRPLRETISGRLYYLQVVASHWREVPLTGSGAGAFPARFAVWQQLWLDGHHDRQTLKFASALDHAHNDYLELAVDYGLPSLGAFLLLAGWQVRRGSPGPTRAGLAALAAIALVDFPLHRPAESALFWLLLGWAGASNRRPTDIPRRDPQ